MCDHSVPTLTWTLRTLFRPHWERAELLMPFTGSSGNTDPNPNDGKQQIPMLPALSCNSYDSAFTVYLMFSFDGLCSSRDSVNNCSLRAIMNLLSQQFQTPPPNILIYLFQKEAQIKLDYDEQSSKSRYVVSDGKQNKKMKQQSLSFFCQISGIFGI